MATKVHPMNDEIESRPTPPAATTYNTRSEKPPNYSANNQGFTQPQGQPQHGQQQYGQTKGQPQYDQPQAQPNGQQQYGQPQGQPNGQPQYGQPQGQPNGQQQYGQPQYSQPQYGQPQYGQPQYGQPQGQSQYGQQHSTVDVAGGYPVSNVGVTARPNDYLGFSIFTCLCCFCPTGIYAIIYACMSQSSSDRQDYSEAQEEGNMANICSIISLKLGIIWIIGVVLYSYV